MSNTVLLAVDLHPSKPCSSQALASLEVAGGLARGLCKTLYVLCVYDYRAINTTGLSGELGARYREEQMHRIDGSLRRKIAAYIAPFEQSGIDITTDLRVGQPREVIGQVAAEIEADILIIVNHDRHNMVEMLRGWMRRRSRRHVPGPMLLIAPKENVYPMLA
jgi:hypothetical protein